MSRLTIEISREDHQKIKALAALKGPTIKEYVMDKIFEQGLEKLVCRELSK